MKKTLESERTILSLFFTIVIFILSNPSYLNAQTPDPNQGLRADWMRGTYGLNWKPQGTVNGHGESIYIDSFLAQIEGLRALDYIQLHLGESFTTSSVHLGPHDLLESFWQGDTDAFDNPINLVVPRAASGRDPFLDMLIAVKAKGLKTQVLTLEQEVKMSKIQPKTNGQ